MFDTLVNAISKGNILVITIAILFKLSAIYEFFDTLSQRRLIFLEQRIKQDNLTAEIKQLLQEQKERLIFKKIVGIDAGKSMRKQIFDLANYSKDKLKLTNFKKAKDFLGVDQRGMLEIRPVATEDKLLNIFYHVSAFFLAVCGILILVFLVFFPEPIETSNLPLILVSLLNMLLLFAGAMACVSQTLAIPTANKIKKEISHYHRYLLKKHRDDEKQTFQTVSDNK